MAKTYTSVPTVSTLATYPSATYNTYTAQNINNLIVPPAVRVVRTTAFTPTSGVNITWSSAGYDTDSMFAAGSPTILTVNTSGLYVATFSGYLSAATSLVNPVAFIVVNGTSQVGQYLPQIGANAIFSVSAVLDLTATNTVSATCTFGGTGPFSLSGTTTDYQQTRLSLTWLNKTS